jgi:hypothetical protein
MPLGRFYPASDRGISQFLPVSSVGTAFAKFPGNAKNDLDDADVCFC